MDIEKIKNERAQILAEKEKFENQVNYERKQKKALLEAKIPQLISELKKVPDLCKELNIEPRRIELDGTEVYEIIGAHTSNGWGDIYWTIPLSVTNKHGEIKIDGLLAGFRQMEVQKRRFRKDVWFYTNTEEEAILGALMSYDDKIVDTIMEFLELFLTTGKIVRADGSALQYDNILKIDD